MAFQVPEQEKEPSMRKRFAVFKDPRLMPAFGIAAACLVWLMDSLVDHFLLNRDEPYLVSFWPDEPQELWMRALVVVLFIALSWYARMLLRNEARAQSELIAHQAELEEIIAARTQELQDNYHKLQTEMAERQQAQTQLEMLATTDPLTRLYNRRKFEELLAHELERCRRYAGDFAVVLFDVDHFKRVNDQLGHDVGDTVLQFLADLVRSQLRKTDAVARWGGEEFIALVFEADADTSLAVAEKLRQLVEAGQFPHQLQITISLGIAFARRDDTAASLIKRADKALYTAKREGRNRTILELPGPPPQPVSELS
jgi:diguanylate cyclase (GGDEF)-like protein